MRNRRNVSVIGTITDDSYNYPNYGYNKNTSMLFEEFKYYNNTIHLIDEKIVDNIKEKLKSGEKHIFWSNEEYCKNSIVFLFYRQDTTDEESNRNTTKEPVVLKTEYFVKLLDKDFSFTYDEFNGIKDIIHCNGFLKFKPTAEEYNFINNYLEQKEQGLVLYKLFDDIIDYCIKNKAIDVHNVGYDAILNVANVMGIKITKPKYKLDEDKIYYNSYCYHIFHVYEKRINNINYRIAFNKEINKYESNEYFIKIFDENNEYYNYIDKDSVYISDNELYFLEKSLITIGKDNSIDIDIDVIDNIRYNIHRILGKNDKPVITQAIYRFYSTNVRRKKQLKHDLDEKEMKLIEQYTKLLKMGKTIKLEQVHINLNSIQTEDNLFNIKFDNTFFNMQENFVDLKKEIDKGDAKYNFNILYDIILKNSTLSIIEKSNTKNDSYKNFIGTKFIVNNMEINVIKDGNRININGIFCRIDDTSDILNKAICFNNIDDYNRYVKDVSYIGLELKKLIGTGIHLYLENPITRTLKKLNKVVNEKTILRFTLLWDSDKRNNVFLVLNNKKYLIRYKHKFLKNFNYPECTITVARLKEYLSECLENFQDELILEIIINAVEEAKIIEEKGKLLLASTIKDTNAKEITITTNDTNMSGYEVVGVRTGNKYFIDKFHLNVYRYDDGKWNRRCVVSDPNKQRIYEDRMANRLVNIFNENKRITTLFN